MRIYRLYVKTHKTTGLKYLGQTTKKDPYSYPGSGKLWKRHLKKHGYDYDTEILHECKTKQELEEKGLYYSDLCNVVASKEWANLKPETGDGGDMSMCEAYITGMSNRDISGAKNPRYNVPVTEETRIKMSNAKKGKMPANLDAFTKSAKDHVWYYNPLTGEQRLIKKDTIIPDGFTKGNIKTLIDNTVNPRKPTPVHCVELDMDFPTLKSAAQFVNLKCTRDIVDSIIGRNQRKTAAGYHWQFLLKD